MRVLSRGRGAAWGVLGGLLLGVAADAQAPPRMELRPSDASFDEEFTQVWAIRELSDGRLIVADRRERRLVILEPRDGSTRDVARTGNGPGEFQSIHKLVPLPGDSTLLTDGQNGRWLVLAGDKPVQTIAADLPLPKALHTVAGADASGHVIAVHLDTEIRMQRMQESREGRPSVGIDSLVILRGNRATGRIDTIGRLRSRSQRIKPVERSFNGRRIIHLLVNPLETDEQTIMFPDGWAALVRLYAYRVDWRRPDGALQRGEPIATPVYRVDDREKQFVLGERFKLGGGQAPITADDFPAWPEALPPFLDRALFATPEGRVVVERLRGAAVPEPRYDVIDRRGVLNGQLVLRPNERIAGFGARSVYIVERDVDDIERIRRHPWLSAVKQ